MKSYSEYGAAVRQMLSRMHRNHPKATRVYSHSEPLYGALEADGWVQMTGSRSATLTDKGFFKMSAIVDINNQRESHK